MGGTLVESTPFVQRVMGSTPALADSVRAVSGAPLSSRGLEEAL